MNNGNFDIVIGHIEDIVISVEFQNMIKNFMQNHYLIFDESDENKIIYTDIYNQYSGAIETYIISSLQSRLINFDMNQFAKELEKRKAQLDGEIFELLFSLTDFLTFKELILDYKAYKEGKFKDLDMGITVTRIVECRPNLNEN